MVVDLSMLDVETPAPARGELRRAGKVGIGTWIGMLVAAVAKVVLAVAMVATYAVAYSWR